MFYYKQSITVEEITTSAVIKERERETSAECDTNNFVKIPRLDHLKPSPGVAHKISQQKCHPTVKNSSFMFTRRGSAPAGCHGA